MPETTQKAPDNSKGQRQPKVPDRQNHPFVQKNKTSDSLSIKGGENITLVMLSVNS